MIKLVGYVGGDEVNFDFYPPDQFKAIIPKRRDGVYIVELKAIDDAGNETNYNEVVIQIDYNKMSVKILPMNYIDKVENLDIIENTTEEYIVKELLGYSFKIRLLEYAYRELII